MVRHVLMFPLTRLVVAGLAFAGLAGLLSIPTFLVDLSDLGTLVGPVIEALAALGALLFVGKLIERRPLAKIGFPGARALPNLGIGLALGAALLTTVVGAMALAGWYRVEGFAWDLPDENAAAFALVGLGFTALIAIGEEVLMRGILFRILDEWLGSWIALALSALVFGLLHITNPNASLWAGIAIALEAGILFGAVYILTRGLWLPIGLHWTWNFFEGWVYGTPVSGLDVPGLLRSTTAPDPTLWTGGSFGPEAGLVAVFVCGGAGLFILARCAREGRIHTPPWLARLTGVSSPSPMEDERAS